MSTFAPALNPSIGSGWESEPRVLRADFGDGYSTRVGDGLNSVKKNVSLSWSDLTSAQADDIETFFEGLEPGESFEYTMPLYVTPVKFIVTKWSRQYRSGINWSMTAEFEKVYDL